MSRLSAVGNLTRGVLRSPQGRALLVRCLSDDSDSPCVPPTDQVQGSPKICELEKPSGGSSHLVIWPDVKAMNMHLSESSESSDDGITATWDFRNNELDVEQLAGLPCPSDPEDVIMASEEAEESYEEAMHRQIQDELQFGRMRSLREQLTKELESSETFTSDERTSLTSVRENVDFMMQELSQISSLLKTLYPEQANVTTCSASNGMSQDNNVLGTPYTEPQAGSWLYKRSSSGEEMLTKVSSKDSEITSESEGMSTQVQLSSDQETQAVNEVICADDSTSTEPSESSPKTDGKQELQPKEAIHTYRPFRTIEVPSTKPSRSLSSQANTQAAPVQEEVTTIGSVFNPPMGPGFSVSAQLSEQESRVLMRMALKQALVDLESGKTNYKATLLVAKDEERPAEK